MKEKHIGLCSQLAALGLLVSSSYEALGLSADQAFFCLPTLWHLSGGINRQRVTEVLRRAPHFEVGSVMQAAVGNIQTEDTVFTSELGAIGACDGKGGLPAGEVASQLMVEVVNEVLQERHITANSQPERVIHVFREAWSLTQYYMLLIEDRVKNLSLDQVLPHRQLSDKEQAIVAKYLNMISPTDQEGLRKEHMGTTAVVAQVVETALGSDVVIAHSGDSRLYVVKATGKIQRLTTDHVGVIEELVKYCEMMKQSVTADTILSALDQAEDLESFQAALNQLEPGLGELAAGITSSLSQLSQSVSCQGSYQARQPEITRYHVQREDICLLAVTDFVFRNLTTKQIQESLFGVGETDMTSMSDGDVSERVKANLNRGTLITDARAVAQQDIWRSVMDDGSFSYLILNSRH